MSTVILTAHGSKDPRSAANTRAVAGQLRRLAPELDVRVAYCEQNTPNLRDVLADVSDDVLVAPFLLASAYHAGKDIPALIAESTPPGVRVSQTDVLGEDDRLVHVMRERLTEAGASQFDADLGVVAVAVGSSNPGANARTARIAAPLARGTHWAGVEVAFATGPKPSVAEAVGRLADRGASRFIIAPWFLAHGRITDKVADYARREGIPMAEPLGAHRLVAATVLDRVEAVLAEELVA